MMFLQYFINNFARHCWQNFYIIDYNVRYYNKLPSYDLMIRL